MSKTARIPIRTQKAPLPPPFLSQGIVVGDMAYCSGQVGVNPATGKMVEGSIQERTKQILHNLNAVLEAGGSSLQDAVKVNIFLADMNDFAAVNEVYSSFFADPKPVCSLSAIFFIDMLACTNGDRPGHALRSRLYHWVPTWRLSALGW
ncbi:YjgF-like protein [Aspergillus sclerotiicarbonarius CBS 121057]|uniref:YjgF-like protein n=1 Tax=Aspergillus sclerotiicarbonarius (strain CBS 121057 / IBT 28362) TaxID=1448318 RepID=A0A319F7D1_ASPSB|nr:YjgF-like protein [Aspergillus sclerotiicarbonarius CBS 121057]